MLQTARDAVMFGLVYSLLLQVAMYVNQKKPVKVATWEHIFTASLAGFAGSLTFWQITQEPLWLLLGSALGVLGYGLLILSMRTLRQVNY